MASVLQALAGFVFTEQALMDSFSAGIVDAVGGTEECGIDAGELEPTSSVFERPNRHAPPR